MTTNLAENIRKYRKERGLTQEQLAEALGVTTGAVYKWEAEKSLCKYPNNFKVVYTCAKAYHGVGVDFKKENYFRRAIELYQKSILLLEDNMDSEINLFSIHKNMSGVYMELGELEKALDLLMSNNPCGLHNAAIGHLMAYSDKRDHEAVKYLSTAFFDSMGTISLMVAGFIKVYLDREDYQAIIDITDWYLATIRGVREEGKQNFWMRTESLFMAIQGDMYCRLDKEQKAIELLKDAKKMAMQFDENPYWGLESFRFIEIKEDWYIHDSLGETAMMAIEKSLSEYASSKGKKLWGKI